jgi:catabolite regulation protein CreA
MKSSSGVYCYVARWKAGDISNEYFASIFRIEEWTKQDTSMKQIASAAASVDFHRTKRRYNAEELFRR